MHLWLTLVKYFVPVIINVAAPGLGALVSPLIVQGITAAEQLAGAVGPEKRAHALELVSVGLAGIAATGKVHVDSDAMLALAGSVIDTTVGVVNLVHRAHADAPLVGGIEPVAGGGLIPAPV